MADSYGFHEQALGRLVDAVRRGDYVDGALWLDRLAAADAERLDVSAASVVAGWEERARSWRGAGDAGGAPTAVEPIPESRWLFAALLRHSFDGVVLNGRASRMMLEVSDSFCELTGYAREELVGRTSVELGLVADNAAHAEVAARADAGVEGLYETELRRKDGDVRLVEFSNQLLANNELVVSIIRDVTAHRRAEEALRAARSTAQEASRAKSEFLARMSHELRIPLNVILGFSQLLELEDLSAEQRENVEQIVKSARRLLDLSTEVLDIARIESGQLSVSAESVSVVEIAQETIELVRPLADRRDIRLHTSRDGELHELQVTADPGRLEQVLLNLVSNAVKYNADGGEVHVACSRPGSGRIRVEVADTGIGIAEEKVSLLFTPFERLGADRVDVEGTGLGLALSRGLVEAMAGRMGVDSTIGKGSTFWFELPAASAVSPKRAAVPAALPLKASIVPDVSGTVLYIEDDFSNVLLIGAFLRLRPNVKLVSAVSAKHGLELIGEHSPDLVLLDLQLPDDPGEQVLRRLRADPRTAQVPIVIASAEAAPGQSETLRASGADDYLTKPIDVEALLGVVDRVLGAS